MKILVCGGRYYTDRTRVFQVLDDLHFGTGPDGGPLGTQRLISCVIHGACGVEADDWLGDMQGADGYAEEWAIRQEVCRHRYPAAWRRLGKKAGPLRNQEMIDKERPDLVVAFPGSTGTADMIRRAKGCGIRVIEVAP